jgi:hypothetical protein
MLPMILRSALAILLCMVCTGQALAAVQDFNPQAVLLTADDIDGAVTQVLNQSTRVEQGAGVDLYLVGYQRTPGTSDSNALVILSELVVADTVPPPGSLDGVAQGIPAVVGGNPTITPLGGPALGDDYRWLSIGLTVSGQNLEMLMMVYQVGRNIVVVATMGLPGTLNINEVYGYAQIMGDRLS